MDEEREDENLTEDEEEAVEDGGMSGEEAHRYEEFEELNGRLNRVLAVLDSIVAALNDLQAVSIESGAIVTDNDGSEDIEIEALDEDMGNWKWDED